MDQHKKPARVLNKNQSYDIAKACRVVDAMLAAGPELLTRHVLLAHLKTFGLAMNGWSPLGSYQEWYNASTFGVLQNPTEYVDYLLYCARSKPASCIEIGVYTGGLAVFSCAFFQALNPDFRYVGIDINDKLLINEALVDRLNLEFRIPASSDDVRGEVFDIVFIDGDHSYVWAKRDFLNLGRHAAKVCAFHDIHGKEYLSQGGGVYKFWRPLRSSLAQKMTMVECTHAGPEAGVEADSLWMGIGILDYTTAASDT